MKLQVVLGVALAASLAAVISARGNSAPDSALPPPGATGADSWAWTLLAQSTKPASTLDTRAGWLTWPDASLLFGSSSSNPPVWPTPSTAAHPGSAGTTLSAATATVAPNSTGESACNVGGEAFDPHFNLAEFDYITKEAHVWNKKNLQDFLNGPPPASVDFPPDSVSVKAAWRSAANVLMPGKKTRFFTADPNNHGVADQALIALHISAKTDQTGNVAPNWFWATFEQISNPCLGAYAQPDSLFDYRGGKLQQCPKGDSACIHANGKVLRAAKPKGKWSTIMKDLDQNVWQNYRLIGVQTGSSPPDLGNSVIETNMATGASCMKCHSHASADAGGNVANPPPTPTPMAPHSNLDFVWGFLCFNSPTCTLSDQGPSKPAVRSPSQSH